MFESSSKLSNYSVKNTLESRTDLPIAALDAIDQEGVCACDVYIERGSWTPSPAMDQVRILKTEYPQDTDTEYRCTICGRTAVLRVSDDGRSKGHSWRRDK